MDERRYEDNLPPRIQTADRGTRAGYIDRRKKDYVAWELCGIWPVQLYRCYGCFDISVCQLAVHIGEFVLVEYFCEECKDWYHAHFTYWGGKGEIDMKAESDTKGIVH